VTLTRPSVGLPIHLLGAEASGSAAVAYPLSRRWPASADDVATIIREDFCHHPAQVEFLDGERWSTPLDLPGEGIDLQALAPGTRSGEQVIVWAQEELVAPNVCTTVGPIRILRRGSTTDLDHGVDVATVPNGRTIVAYGTVDDAWRVHAFWF
jgi:hypothetical protein